MKSIRGMEPFMKQLALVILALCLGGTPLLSAQSKNEYDLKDMGTAGSARDWTFTPSKKRSHSASNSRNRC